MDKIIRYITKDGGFAASAVNTSDIVYTAQKVHGLSKTATAALGRLLTASSLMGAALKNNAGQLTLKINGGGPLGNIVTVADSKGNTRGYLDNPSYEIPLRADGKLNVGAAVGKDGMLAVMRDNGSGAEPYIGQVKVVSGEIAEDITEYYAVSEQIPTVCSLGVLVDKNTGEAMLSGGLLIQALPGVNDGEIDRLEENIRSMEPVTTMLAKGMSIEDICGKALAGFDYEMLDSGEVHYVCTCSKERYSRALATLGKKELEDMIENREDVETVCQYCGKKYVFSKSEIMNIISGLEKK